MPRLARRAGLDDGDECLIRRVLVRKGRARAFINGRSASGAQLRALGDLLVDIHGQHAHQSLLRPAAQRALLDAYGGHEARPRGRRPVPRYRELDTRWRELTAARDERAERIDLLRFQVQELDDLALADGELDELDAEQRRLANLGSSRAPPPRWWTCSTTASGALRDQLGHAAGELAGLTDIDPADRDPRTARRRHGAGGGGREQPAPVPRRPGHGPGAARRGRGPPRAHPRHGAQVPHPARAARRRPGERAPS
jgi:DNA repair protein RecN (Recombination protein N)